MNAFKTQQRRWALGTTQTARKLLGRILRSSLPAKVKLEATVHLTNNFAYPLVLLLAVLMPWSVWARGHGSLSSLLLLDVPAFALASMSVALFYALSQQQAYPGSWWRHLGCVPLVMALGIGMSVSQSRAVFAGMFEDDTPFVRTPKSGDTDNEKRTLPQASGHRTTVAVELLLAAYLAAGMVWAGWSGHFASLPFLGLFSAGFAYVGLTSIGGTLRQRTASALHAPTSPSHHHGLR
jgi:hypothetical protein